MASAPFTSQLAEELAPDLLDRFLRYVRVDTQSRREHDGTPSTPGQIELGELLVSELREIGLTDAAVDEHGYVMATLESTNGADGPVIGLLAHVDTSPDAPGAGVDPIVHRDYDGGVIELPNAGTRLDPAVMTELADKQGHHIVTSSGDTLLGADDKAGVSEIMAAVAHLAAHPELPRPTLRVGFTPDEEIGEGALTFDIERFGARCAYTLDGSDLGELQDETFSALEARVVVHGVEVHPGQATGKLVNAVRLAAQIIAALPSDRLTPETTAGRDGFIHPYEINGTPARAEFRAILRDFDDDKLEQYAALVEQTAHEIVGAVPRATVDVEIRRQYRNMRRYIDPVPEIVDVAAAAIRAEGIEPVKTPIRGGTDGSILSERGLPTPNIFTGGHEYHSVREWASLQEMSAAAATIVRLAEMWTRPESATNGAE
jgi:tripeptide aminopeptidase